MAKPINPNLDLLPCSKCKGASGEARRKGESWCASCNRAYHQDYNQKYIKKGRRAKTRFRKLELEVVVKTMVAAIGTQYVNKLNEHERAAFSSALERLRLKEINE